MVRSPEAVERALPIFEHSNYLTDILVRHPDDISLLEPFAADRPETRAKPFFESDGDASQASPTAADSVFLYLARDAVETPEAMAILRRQYRRCVFLPARAICSHG